MIHILQTNLNLHHNNNFNLHNFLCINGTIINISDYWRVDWFKISLDQFVFYKEHNFQDTRYNNYSLELVFFLFIQNSIIHKHINYFKLCISYKILNNMECIIYYVIYTLLYKFSIIFHSHLHFNFEQKQYIDENKSSQYNVYKKLLLNFSIHLLEKNFHFSIYCN